MTKTVVLDYQPQPRQALAHSVRVRQILYGGAMGGGKSVYLRWDAIAFCLQNPGLDAYLFRRTLGELEDNHIRTIQRELPSTLGEYRESKKRFEFFNGSGINFCYCEKLKDVYRYQGAEMHWVGLDEAGQLEPQQIAFLKTRSRLGSFVPQQKGLLPRFVMASNPGGPAHAYLKRRMIDPAPPETVFYDEEMRDPRDPSDKGWSSIYIPAKMSDNKFIDTDYASALGALAPELQKAYREGDWDVVVGAALHSLDKRIHQVRAFKPPRHWTKFMSIDWGSAKPFAVSWFTVSEGAWLDAKGDWPKVYLPPGALIMYEEWYGWNGKENEGCRMESQAVAREILRREQERGEIMDYRVGDSQMWASSDGPSPEERMRLATDGRFVLMQAQKDRKINYGEILARLAGEEVDVGEKSEKLPMLYITANCRHAWRTLPSLVLDENDPEKGPADEKKQEDHCLVGETEILTPHGAATLADLTRDGIAGGKVWTNLGWMPFVNLGMTQRYASIWRVEFDNDAVIEGTESHMVLTKRGWQRLDALRYDDAVVVHKPGHLTWHSISMAKRSGFAAGTINAAVAGFIAWCGSFTTGPFREAFTSIISMGTAPTMRSVISNLSPHRSTSSGTPTRQSTWRMPSGTWKQGCDQRPSRGTSQRRAGLGTETTPKKLGPFRRGLSVLVRFARSVFSRSIETSGFVRRLVISESSVVGIRIITVGSRRADVFNLHVPLVNNFAINGGVIVHNCYDSMSYACRSRPYVTTEEDRWEDENREMIKEARKEKSDPYYTGR